MSAGIFCFLVAAAIVTAYKLGVAAQQVRDAQRIVSLEIALDRQAAEIRELRRQLAWARAYVRGEDRVPPPARFADLTQAGGA